MATNPNPDRARRGGTIQAALARQGEAGGGAPAPAPAPAIATQEQVPTAMEIATAGAPVVAGAAAPTLQPVRHGAARRTQADLEFMCGTAIRIRLGHVQERVGIQL